jgi:Kef-type K+ transport system membrane component KefB
MTRLAAFINKQSIRAYMAMGIVVFSLTYLLVVSFLDIPTGSKEIVILVIGYIMGLTSTVVAYYFGSNKKVDENQEQ